MIPVNIFTLHLTPHFSPSKFGNPKHLKDKRLLSYHPLESASVTNPIDPFRERYWRPRFGKATSTREFNSNPKIFFNALSRPIIFNRCLFCIIRFCVAIVVWWRGTQDFGWPLDPEELRALCGDNGKARPPLSIGK